MMILELISQRVLFLEETSDKTDALLQNQISEGTALYLNFHDQCANWAEKHEDLF